MKRLIIIMVFVAAAWIKPERAKGQLVIAEIIKQAIVKVIKAADLEIQRQQNKVIWLQNAQKTLENNMSKLKLREISDWTEKQRSLYQQYYEELHQVKAVITYYKRIREIMALQLRMVEEYKQARSLFRKDQHFTSKELDYMEHVYGGIIAESLKNLETLQLVVNSFRAQMSDAERMELISEAGERMEANYQDLLSFNLENKLLSLRRAKDAADAASIKRLYGLK